MALEKKKLVATSVTVKEAVRMTLSMKNLLSGDIRELTDREDERLRAMQRTATLRESADCLDRITIPDPPPCVVSIIVQYSLVQSSRLSRRDIRTNIVTILRTVAERCLDPLDEGRPAPSVKQMAAVSNFVHAIEGCALLVEAIQLPNQFQKTEERPSDHESR